MGILWTIVTVLGLVVGATAMPAVAQVPTVSGSRLDIVEIIQNDVPGTVVVYTVPDKKRLIITDLIVNGATSPSITGGSILRNGLPATSRLLLGTASLTIPFSHAFVTGIEFGAGDTVSVQGSGNWYLRGYLTKP